MAPGVGASVSAEGENNGGGGLGGACSLAGGGGGAGLGGGLGRCWLEVIKVEVSARVVEEGTRLMEVIVCLLEVDRQQDESMNRFEVR